jgi:hypothetical protein
MGRPHLGPRERLRVELRLSPQIAEMLYDSAQQWDVSLSEAGARLIQLGYPHNGDEPTRTT